ncbi:carboxypeptidase regulatory-like domain-containing protein [Mycetocola tolaasinivorans]|nr:carboxypeptidase regulatory-like domain-containing protein [Mycetocola tolaasinivorans]
MGPRLRSLTLGGVSAAVIVALLATPVSAQPLPEPTALIAPQSENTADPAVTLEPTVTSEPSEPSDPKLVLPGQPRAAVGAAAAPGSEVPAGKWATLSGQIMLGDVPFANSPFTLVNHWAFESGETTHWRTDAQGKFSARVSAGLYAVNYEPPAPFYTSANYEDAVEVRAGATVALGKIQAKRGVEIGGTMTLPPGFSIGEIFELGVENAAGTNSWRTTQSRVNATTVTWRATVPAGKYRVAFSRGDRDFEPQWWKNAKTSASATLVTVVAGKPQLALNATLATRGSTLSGRVLDSSGKPVAGAEVSASGPNGASSTAQTTGSTGAFMLAGLSAGAWTVSVRAPYTQGAWLSRPQWYSGAAFEKDATKIVIASGAPTHRTGIDIKMLATGSVSGTVSVRGTGGLVRTHLIPVGVEPERDNNWDTANYGTSFLAEGLVPGKYNVYFSGPTGRLQPVPATDGNPRTVTVVAGKTVSLNLVLRFGGFIIDSGNGALEFVDADTGAIVDRAYMDGKYVSGTVLAGSRVKIRDRDGEPRYVPGNTTAANARIFTVTEGSYQPVNINNSTRTSISGRVTDAGGAAVSGAQVELHVYQEWGGYTTEFAAYTGPDGRYSFTGLRVTTQYQVFVRSENPLRESRWYGGNGGNDGYTGATALWPADTTPITGVNIVLGAVGAARGSISGSGSVEDSYRISAVAVDGSGRTYSTWSPRVKDASWTLPGLRPGDYTLRIERRIREVTSVVLERKITVKAGAWTDTGQLSETKPAITAQPKAVSAAVGARATLSVTASGPSLSYRWQQRAAGSSGSGGWSDVAYATAPTLTVTPKSVAADNKREYRVIIFNAVGSVTSATAILTVPKAKSGAITVKAPAKATYGSPVAVPVQVARAAGAKADATGTVRAYSGTAEVAKATLSGGKATLSVPVSALGVGTRALRFAYAGTAEVDGVSTNASIVVAKATATVTGTVPATIKPKARPVIPVSVTAGKTPATGKVTVTFARNGSKPVTVTANLSAGKAQITTPSLAATGSYTVTVAYAGSGNVSAKTQRVGTFSLR